LFTLALTFSSASKRKKEKENISSIKPLTMEIVKWKYDIPVAA
jgi:hypothetical protein